MKATSTNLLAGAQSLQTFIAETHLVLAKLMVDAQIRLHTALREPEERELTSNEAQRIQGAYQVWLARYELMDGESRDDNATAETQKQKAFAEQVSYAFFVRLLLACVLKDKGLIPHMVSDGDIIAFLKTPDLDSCAKSRDEAFLSLVYQHVVGFERHFFQQPVFDWFQPDDSLLALVLSRLKQCNFRDVSNDLLGFTYEAFIERVARNQKGHFLTPPDVVEFMLDRVGYTSSAIIGEKLLDMSCGSGSFLVHAARRLRNCIQATMINSSPIERARTFIEQVQTKLVGLEINPFSCYLAELNLFIQVLDDLALLQSQRERLDIECFSIYNTNSLELPPEILRLDYKASATSTFQDQGSVLNKAEPVKSLQKAFTYILCNPPYVNRGIILGAKKYSDYPFYREVVKGDENFYLLFLRLATYYLAPGGTLCFICPLNLLGDESTTRARELFNRTDDWCLRSITRFYARTILFSGVLQGVCVIHIDQVSVQPTDDIEIRGGFSLQEATRNSTHIAYTRVTANYPASPTGSKPWLVNTAPEAYNVWEFIRQHAQQDLAELIVGKLATAKGDVRSTWARPMLVPGARDGAIPLTKGAKIADWGSWSAARYLDPSATIPSTIPNYKSSLWVQKNIQRIMHLTQTETVLLLKEVAGLEMKRPIRGTIIQRSTSQPVVADETVLVMYTRDATHEDLAYAVFGLITSSLYNFLFSLFSTNAHANFKEIHRLPVPIWSEKLEKYLAETTREMLRIYQERNMRQISQHQQLLDEQVIEAYGITQPAWRKLVSEGVPWAR